MADNSFGPLGWFSAAGFAVLSPLYAVDVYGIASYPVSLELTGAVALPAAIGAVALWYGHDLTASEQRTPRTA